MHRKAEKHITESGTENHRLPESMMLSAVIAYIIVYTSLQL